MKRSELLFSAVQVPIDFLMLMSAALAAFFLRDVLPRITQLVPEKLFQFPFEQYVVIVAAVVPLFLLIYAIDGLYTIRTTRKPLAEAWAVMRATTIGLMAIIVIVFLHREWFSSRVIILTAWALAIVFVVSARVTLRMVQRWFLVHKRIGVHRVLLIGDTHIVHAMRRDIATDPTLGYRVVAQLETAHIGKIRTIRAARGVDEIIIGDPSLPDTVVEKLVDYCKINNIGIRIVPTSLQTVAYEFDAVAGVPMIVFVHTPLDGWGKILKRTFDLIAASIGLIVVSPVLLLIALAIRLEDPDGPIIFKNERIGDDGKKFFVYKFRYMQWRYSTSQDNPHCAEALALEKQLIAHHSVRQGPLYKIKDDPRKTRIGTFIERYSLDELPQLFNVLVGNMSLVGPRPHQEREVEKYKAYHRQLLTIKPGVTGMAQVSGRSDLDFEDEYRYDVYYIEHWSLWLDIMICLKTVRVLFARRRNNSDEI